MISAELLGVLACPVCVKEPGGAPEGRRPGELELAGDGLKCLQCGRLYPVTDGIPVMLVEEATGGDGAGEGEGAD